MSKAYGPRGTLINDGRPETLPPAEMDQASPQEARIPVDGFRQVLELLRAADAGFRDSLLRRIAARDRPLAQSLIQELKKG